MPDPTPTQKMLANVRALRQQNAPEDVVQAEMARWQSRIAQYNEAEGQQARYAGGAAGALESVTESTSLGAAGFIGDAVGAAIDPNQSFADMRGNRRARSQQYAEAHPVANVVGSIAGGVITPGAAAKQGASLLARLSRMAAEGAVTAGVEGAVRGTDDFTGDALRRAASSGIRDAAIGGIAAPVAGQVLGAGVRGARRVMDPAASPAARALLRGGGDELIPQANAALDAARAAGMADDVMPADVIPGGARALRAMANLSPQGGEMATSRLNERGARVGDRAEAALSRATGLNAQDVSASVSDLVQRRAANADPLYAAARAEGAVNRMTPRSPEMDAFLREPDVQAAIARLRQTREFRDVPDDAPEMLDAVYKVFSDRQSTLRASQLTDPNNLGRFQGRDIASAKSQALEAISGERGPMPSYRPAVEGFASDSRLNDAYESGVELFNRPVGQVREAMAQMTPDERDLFKRGVMDALVERRIDPTAPNPGLADAARQSKKAGQSAIDTRSAMKRVREVFGDAEYENILRAAQQEGVFFNTAAEVTRNSSTARQLADMGLFGEMADEAVNAIGRNPTEAATNFLSRNAQRGVNAVRRTLSEPTYRAAADRLSQKGDGSVMSLIEEMNAEIMRRQSAKELGQNVAGRLGAGTGRGAVAELRR